LEISTIKKGIAEVVSSKCYGIKRYPDSIIKTTCGYKTVGLNEAT
jgi:hypothetical protein